jgi:hypothetical protein
MCSERDALGSQRCLMVSRTPKERGCAFACASAHGTVETMDETEQRLLNLTGVQQVDLFGRSQADLLDAAYRKRARVVAYRRREA